MSPALFARDLLSALGASEGRRKRRVRDTTPDAIGMRIKRGLLEEIAAAAPAADELEGWLLARCAVEGESDGPVRAMALMIWDEWRLAASAGDFRAWLASGAPSDDREPGPAA